MCIRDRLRVDGSDKVNDLKNQIAIAKEDVYKRQVLDIFFIAGLGMGVGAAALATAISQFASAIFCMIHLMRTKEEYRLQISKIGFDGLMMKQIIQNGVPSGFQNSDVYKRQVLCQ